MTSLPDLAKNLARAVSGLDWDAGTVQETIDAMLRSLHQASSDDRDYAFDVLIRRLRAAAVEDADCVAHVAITAGTLVENGANAAPLARALLVELPSVLVSARRYANLCLEGSAEPGSDEEADAAWEDALLAVDDRPISYERFRSHLEADRAGAAALAHLEQWTLPAVAAMVRDRASLLRARSSETLVSTARALRHSVASWLFSLLVCELDATWIVLCPSQSRGFELLLEGVATNFTLHELVANALVERGIPGRANAPGVIAFLRGESDRAPDGPVFGSFNFYDYRAAAFDVADPHGVPQTYWVWNEGLPEDIPPRRGQKVLLVGAPPYERTWNAARPFSRLKSLVDVVRELSSAEVDSWRNRLRENEVR